MASYYCQICGAKHKEAVRQCRLCGADMTGLPIPAETGLSAVPITTPKKGIKGLVGIGMLVVVVLIVGGVAFGVVQSNKQVEAVKNKLVTHVDGWTVQQEPDPSQPPTSDPASAVGHFVVDLPGDRTRETIDFVGTDNGKLTVWTAKIGSDAVLRVGWGTITPPAPGKGPNGTSPDQIPTGQNYLKDKAANWITANGLTTATVTQNATVIAGEPAYVVKGTASNTTLNGTQAYTQMAMVLAGDKLYVLLLVSTDKQADQLDKMAGSLGITG
jgi:hypothetical protein